MYVTDTMRRALRLVSSRRMRKILARIVRRDRSLAIIIRREIRFSMATNGARRRQSDDDGETGNTTTTDGGTVPISIIQYYSLSKSEKPDMPAEAVQRLCDCCADCQTNCEVAAVEAWLPASVYGRNKITCSSGPYIVFLCLFSNGKTTPLDLFRVFSI